MRTNQEAITELFPEHKLVLIDANAAFDATKMALRQGFGCYELALGEGYPTLHHVFTLGAEEQAQATIYFKAVTALRRQGINALVA